MRTLAVFSLSFSAAVLCARFCGSTAAVLALSAAFFLLFIILCLLREMIPLPILIASVGAAAGFGWFFLFSSSTLQQAKEISGDRKTIAVLTTDYPVSASFGSSVHGILATEDLPALGIILYDGSFSAADTEPGQILICEAVLKASDMRYGAQYDGYCSAGIFLIATAEGKVEFGEKHSSIRFLPVKLKKTIMIAADRFFPPEIRPFMKSLMLGDKTDLYTNTAQEYALSASGIMHVVAVSGMHIAFIIGFVQLLFGSSRKSSVVCLVTVWFFVLLTGCSPSAVRAGIMQSILLMAPIFGRENDSLTALSLALLILLLFNPFSVMSVSLQLSFSAMAGILLFSDHIRNFFVRVFGKSSQLRIVQYFIGILSSSLSVMILSVPLTAIHFHSVQLASPITNALVLWAVSICFGGGYAACLLSFILPAVAKLILYPVSILAKYILFCAKVVSKIPYISLYTCSDFAVYWIAGVYALFILFACLRMRKQLKVVIPLAASLISLAFLTALTSIRYNNYDAVFSVIDVAQGECVTAFSGKSTLMVDCGGIFTADNAGETAGQYLLSTGRNRVNLLILTHLHKDHVNGIDMLLEYMPVDEIAISAYVQDDDGQLDKIIKAADAHGTRITWLEEEAEAHVGKISAKMLTPLIEGDTNERCTAVVVSVGNTDMLVTGDAPKAAERQLVENNTIPEIDFLVVGHHGSKTSTSEELIHCLDKNARAVISVGYNTYGHPSEETMRTLLEILSEDNIYRTDKEGTIQFAVGDCYGQETKQF